MLKQFSFYKEYQGFDLQGPYFGLQLVAIESDGNSLYELLSNLQMYAVSASGIGIAVDIGSMANEDWKIVEADVERIYKLQKSQDDVKKSRHEWASEGE